MNPAHNSDYPKSCLATSMKTTPIWDTGTVLAVDERPQDPAETILDPDRTSEPCDPPLPPILQSIPQALKNLIRDPERGRWKAAALDRNISWRWPSWPLQLGLAAVDSRLKAHFVQFIVQPPHGWAEKSEIDLPPHLSVERVFQEGLTAPQAVVLLNEILGGMHVVNNVPFGQSITDPLRKASGIRPTWACPFWGWSSSTVRVNLREHASVEFTATLPSNGDLDDRLSKWADAYVTAQCALRLFTAAVSHPDRLSGAI